MDAMHAGVHHERHRYQPRQNGVAQFHDGGLDVPKKIPAAVLTLTAGAALRLMQQGSLQPATLMDAYLDHIARRDPSVLAFVHFDPAAARAAAAAARPGPLRGIPIGVKDVLDTADMPSQYGSPIWAD